MSDRRVHARTDAAELVRYGRAGKWYIEPFDASPRASVTLNKAVDVAMRWWYAEHGTPIIGVPGGSRFDRMIQQRCTPKEP